MAAGFGALGYDGIQTAVLASLGMADRAADIHNLETSGMKSVDQVARGYAEARDEGRGPLFDDDIGGFLERLGHCRQQVNAEWLLGEAAHLAHLVADFLRAATGHAKRPEASGLGDRGADLGVGNAAHSGEEDGVFDA